MWTSGNTWYRENINQYQTHQLNCTDTDMYQVWYEYKDTIFFKNLCEQLWILGIWYDTRTDIKYRDMNQNRISIHPKS